MNLAQQRKAARDKLRKNNRARPSRFAEIQREQERLEQEPPVTPVSPKDVVAKLEPRPLTRPLPRKLTDNTDASRCLIAVDKGSIKVEFERPHRAVTVAASNAIELPIDKPHRVTVLEEGTSWRHIFTQLNSPKDNIWLIKRG